MLISLNAFQTLVSTDQGYQHRTCHVGFPIICEEILHLEECVFLMNP